MSAAGLSAGSAVKCRPAECRQRQLTQRPVLFIRQRITCAARRDQQNERKSSGGVLIPSTASAAMLWANSARAADVKEAIEGAAAAAQTAQGPPTILGLNLFEVLLLGAPPVLYLIFNVYRSQVNQQAKLVDFVSILAAIVIFGNILSVLVFKVRLY